MNDLDGDGYERADVELTASQCEHITASLPPLTVAGRGGIRDLISHPVVSKFLLHHRLAAFLWSRIGRDLVAVSASLVDRTVADNWRVQWHQDRTIVVRERLDVSGFGPWSTKNGRVRVDAPNAVLAQMVAVRIHLDDCHSDDGLLRVIPGSHTRGKLDEAEIADVIATTAAVRMSMPQGALVLLRPLVLHSSSAAVSTAHRRVLHIEFAPRECISPLEWHTAIALRRVA